MVFAFTRIGFPLFSPLNLGTDFTTGFCWILWRWQRAILTIDPMGRDKVPSTVSADFDGLALFLQAAGFKGEQLEQIRNLMSFNRYIPVFATDAALFHVNIVHFVSERPKGVRYFFLKNIWIPGSVSSQCIKEDGKSLDRLQVLLEARL
jgi:hypothetical protein